MDISVTDTERYLTLSVKKCFIWGLAVFCLKLPANTVAMECSKEGSPAAEQRDGFFICLLLRD
jgi:hypothetical protein